MFKGIHDPKRWKTRRILSPVSRKRRTRGSTCSRHGVCISAWESARQFHASVEHIDLFRTGTTPADYHTRRTRRISVVRVLSRHVWPGVVVHRYTDRTFREQGAYLCSFCPCLLLLHWQQGVRPQPQATTPPAAGVALVWPSSLFPASAVTPLRCVTERRMFAIRYILRILPTSCSRPDSSSYWLTLRSSSRGAHGHARPSAPSQNGLDHVTTYYCLPALHTNLLPTARQKYQSDLSMPTRS